MTQWWAKHCTKIGEKPKKLSGFFVPQHLGATELGSPLGMPIVGMKRRFGYAPASEIAAIYMRPLPPENKAVVVWVRKRLPQDHCVVIK